MNKASEIIDDTKILLHKLDMAMTLAILTGDTTNLTKYQKQIQANIKKLDKI